MSMIRIAAACGVVSALLSVTPARADPCAGFSDVTAASSFCANVAWLKNRAVTTGCGGGTYCPGDPVTRLAMAAFMNRLGKSLTVDTLFSESGTGAVAPNTFDAPWLVCITGDSAAATYPRAMSAEAMVAALADANSMAWAAGIYYSTDAGGTWHAAGAPMRASSNPSVWSETVATTAMDLDVGMAYRFAVGIARDDIAAATTGNFTAGRCQISVGITNRNGDPAGNPFGG